MRERADRQTDRWTPAQMNVLSRRTSRQTDRQRQRHKQQSKVKRARVAWVIFWSDTLPMFTEYL